MIKLLKDILSYLRFKFIDTNYSVGFFCENNYIYHYLKPYIELKSKKNNILIISFEKLDLYNDKNIKLYFFRSNFFRELFFLSHNLKVLYSSTPDLNKTIFKKSKFSNCKYVYLQHSPVSLTMAYNSNAFDNFDAVQAINTFQYDEMKEIKTKKKLKTKIFKGKYLYLSTYISKIQNYKADVLIAPSWNSKFYDLKCHLKLRELLKKNNISFLLRPHPMSIAKKEITFQELDNNKIRYDLSSKAKLNSFRFLISDWSGIFIEFAVVKNYQAHLINTPKKILNKNYQDYSIKPIEISMRNIFGKSFEVEDLNNLVQDLIKKKENFKNLDNNYLKNKTRDIFF